MAKSDHKRTDSGPTKGSPAKPQGTAGPAAPPDGDFPVVGIGASAGGLEAFTELLKALPSNPGMALVLVPHLDPSHDSVMTELLGRATRMPVMQVVHGTRVRPDHVYVIPPNSEMTITEGILALEPRRRSHQHLPIDTFLRSLAEDKQSNAIGVVLSGTASDGTLGLTAIKGEGGITFAQEPKSAKYDGMPSSAVAAGCVDFVMPPARIAAELAHLRRHPYIADKDGKHKDLLAEGNYDLAHLFRILKQVSGVDFSDYKPGTIRRRILRRMALNKIEHLREYVSFLREHRAEVEALYHDILINVTSFFRNPESFAALKQTVYPALVKNRQPNDSIRVWVPGCSTGEEAYSHAIALLEFLSDIREDFPLQVFGTDLSESSIQRARLGIYKQSIAADVSAVRLRRFFTKVEQGYQISKAVRDCCIFARQNVFHDPPFSRIDIVSCRNLLIYLGPALQKKVIPIFHYALRPSGFLMVGNTEGLVGSGTELFEMADKKHKIYSKKAGASSASFGMSLGNETGDGVPARPELAGEKDVETGKGMPDIQREADRLLLARYVPAAVVVNEQMEILQTRGRTGAYLELSPGKASLNLLRMARPGLMFEIQKMLETVRRKGAALRREGLQLENNGDIRPVNLEVIPFKALSNVPQTFMIVFEDGRSNAAHGSGTSRQKPAPSGAGAEDQKDRQLEQLRQELAATKEYLQSIIEEREAANEELQSANEEIQSANEELQSTNEELQTSKEELESANEELNTVNEEMQHRNVQLVQLNDDLMNLLNSVNIPIVMLAPDLSVRRFTPQAEKVLGLSSVDVGRSISNLKLRIPMNDLEQAVLNVLHDIIPTQRKVKHENGKFYMLRVVPYRTSDNKIEGAVITVSPGEVMDENQVDGA